MIPLLLLSGCASLGEYYDDIMSDEREDLIVYKKGKNYEETQYNLEIPPDLITPESTNIMEIPEYAGDKGIDIFTVDTKLDGIKIIRSGRDSYISVNATDKDLSLIHI